MEHFRLARATTDYVTRFCLLIISNTARETRSVGEIDVDLCAVKPMSIDFQAPDDFPDEFGAFSRLLVAHLVLRELEYALLCPLLGESSTDPQT